MTARDIVDRAVIAGSQPHQVFDSLASLVKNFRMTYTEDPR
jgi:hypothetical protein